jgi:hypothetical protein
MYWAGLIPHITEVFEAEFGTVLQMNQAGNGEDGTPRLRRLTLKVVSKLKPNKRVELAG